MTGSTETGVRTEPGWYPDYDAPPGHERYWNGERWTDGRRAVPTTGRRLPLTGLPVWAAAVAVVVLAALVVGLLVSGGDEPRAVPSSSAPPPASTPRAAGSPSAAPSATSDGQRLWRVTELVDGTTLGLDNGAQVRLVGIAPPLGITCATSALFQLAELVDGQSVTLTRRGPDRDAEGHLLRYVERDGVDVGLRLVQRGLARATDESHARGQIYRRVDARTADAC